MNKKIQTPIMVHFYQPADNTNICSTKGNRLYVPIKVNWNDFVAYVDKIKGDSCDSVLIQVDKNVDLDGAGVVNSLNIKINQIIKAAGTDKPVLTTTGNMNDEAWYLMNPSYEEQKKAHGYAPSNETVMNKYNSFTDDDTWQKHQSQIWARMADMMPLSTTDKFGPNHLAQLTSPERGLTKNDVEKFFSFKSNKMISPALMGDNMIGMPGIEGRDYDDFTIVVNGEEKRQAVRSLKTIGKSGFAIPMSNINGDMAKFQIAADPSKINVELKAKASDGVSFQKSEYRASDGTYTFKFLDGTPSNLKVDAVDVRTGEVTFADAKGTFKAAMKSDVLSTLKDRGYDIYDQVATLKVTPSSKYLWPSKGTMVGSTEEVTKTVTPSNPGFIIAREPKDENAKYTVVIAEGALKGHIVAKYINVHDKDGEIFGDKIANDNGIIIAQVPGVARAFVENVKPVYDKFPVEKTIIAMDADGRDNMNVAKGIKAAYECLLERTDSVDVMSWNPDQKGLDDALLAVARGDITINDMGIEMGTPDQLFPIDEANNKLPYKFDGTRAVKAEWQTEYTERRIKNEQEIKKIQDETKQRQLENQNPLPKEFAEVIDQIGKTTITNLIDDIKQKHGDSIVTKEMTKEEISNIVNNTLGVENKKLTLTGLINNIKQKHDNSIMTKEMTKEEISDIVNDALGIGGKKLTLTGLVDDIKQKHGDNIVTKEILKEKISDIVNDALGIDDGSKKLTKDDQKTAGDGGDQI